MFKTEKAKGLPGQRSLISLVVGIVIGVVGVLGVMFVLTMPSCACTPAAAQTTLPQIPTPVPGVTGTAAAQSVSLEKHNLSGFAVNEELKQIALLYADSQTHLEIRPWLETHIGLAPIIELAQNQVFTHPISLNTALQTLAVSTGQDTTIFDLSKSSEATILAETHLPTYSPDGHWLALLKSNGAVQLRHDYLEVITENLQTEGRPYALSFSPDSQMVAVLGRSADEQSAFIEVFQLSDLKRIHFYQIAPGSFSVLPILMFNPTSTVIALGTSTSVMLFSLVDDEQRLFPIPNTIANDFAFDFSGHWLAVSTEARYDPWSVDKNGIYFYLLTEPDHLPINLSAVQFLPHGHIKQIEFVEAGLLVLDTSSTLTLYRRNGDTWGDPTVVLTEADLK